MRIHRAFGTPIALVGVAFLAMAFDLVFELNVPNSAEAQITEIQFGSGTLPVATAISLQYLFLAIGTTLFVLGVAVRSRGGHRRGSTPPPR